MKVYTEVIALIDKVVTSCGLVLYGYELSTQIKGQTALRIFIEPKDPVQKVNTEQCTMIAKQIQNTAKVYLPAINNQYALEVSSPGLERRLFTLNHCLRHIGEKVQLKTKLPINNQRNFQGKMTHIDEDNETIHIETENTTEEIPWSNTNKIHILFES